MSIVTWEFESPSLHAESSQLHIAVFRFILHRNVIPSLLNVLPCRRIVSFILSFVSFYPVQLVRIPEIVPYAVETAGNARDGCHERVAHPDGKNGVFLSAGL